MYEILEYLYSPLKALKTLEEENTRYLIVITGLDCLDPLPDWQVRTRIGASFVNHKKIQLDLLYTEGYHSKYFFFLFYLFDYDLQ